MMPIDPLIIEHKLIERMFGLLKKELTKTNNLDLSFIDAAIDFIRTFADRYHHGKEEDLLFRDLSKSSFYLSTKIMNELIEEDARARKTVSKLVVTKENYV